MSLKNTIRQIRTAKKWTQRDMAAALGLAQADIQRAETAGRNLEKEFTLFCKLLPLADELGIDMEPEINITPQEIIDVAYSKTIGSVAVPQKKGAKKASVSPLPTGRNNSAQRKEKGRGLHN